MLIELLVLEFESSSSVDLTAAFLSLTFFTGPVPFLSRRIAAFSEHSWVNIAYAIFDVNEERSD